jgi:hypothetical protein
MVTDAVKCPKYPLRLTSLHFLHASFSRRMDDILAELRELREIIQSLTPSQPTKVLCKGVTGKGGACRNRAGLGGEYCGMHNGRREAKEVRKVGKKVVKMKKVQPEHTHEGGVCMLCETHGDVWDPRLVDAEFEGEMISE